MHLGQCLQAENWHYLSEKVTETNKGLGVDWVGEGKTDKGPNAYHSTGLI